jgi:hypothetical protein
MDAADGLPHFIIRRGRNRAGVQDHQVRARARPGRLQTFGRKQRFERGAIRLGSPATEVLDEEFPHVGFTNKYNDNFWKLDPHGRSWQQWIR